LLRLGEVNHIFATLETRLDSHLMAVRGSKFLLLLLFGFHLAACAWLLAACPQGLCPGDSEAAAPPRRGFDSPFARVRVLWRAFGNCTSRWREGGFA
jgi:hypothetical protein